MKVAVIQMAPVFLNKMATWDKLKKMISEAAENGAKVCLLYTYDSADE